MSFLQFTNLTQLYYFRESNRRILCYVPFHREKRSSIEKERESYSVYCARKREWERDRESEVSVDKFPTFLVGAVNIIVYS